MSITNMKKILILSVILVLSSCSMFSNEKRNEEFEYFSFNEKNKPIVNKADIYLTKVSKIESLNISMNTIKDKYGENAKHVGSWDFSSKPLKKLKDEIDAKALEFGSNYVILFEKKNCDNIDLKRGNVDPLEGFNCYRILYYHIPEAKLNSYTPEKSEAAPIEASKKEVESVEASKSTETTKK